MSGFKVIKYALKRLKGQGAPPWNEEQLNVLETQPRSISPIEDMNIRARIKIDQTDLTNVEISSQSVDKSPELICKLADIKSKSPSSRKVINTSKEKKTPYKSQELKQNISPKNSWTVLAVQCDEKNGTNLHKNEISLQDKKTPGLGRNLSSGDTSAKKVVNPYHGHFKNPRKNEVGLHDSKTPLDNSRKSSIKNISLHENVLESQDSKIHLPIGKTSQIFPRTPKLEQTLLPRSSSRKKIVNSPRENGSNDKDDKVEQLDKKSKIPSETHELDQIHSLKRPKRVVKTYHKNEPNLQIVSDLESKRNFLNLDEKLSLRNYQNPIDKEVINMSQNNNDRQRYNHCSETSTKCGNKLNPMTNNSPKVMLQNKDLCENNLKVLRLASENEDRDNISDTSLKEYKPFLKLPGQTTILKYFKPNARNNKNDALSKELYNFKTNEPKIKNIGTESPKKKILNNKEVVVPKSLRSNRRPSLYMDNNNFSPYSPECVTSENSPNKSIITIKENGNKYNLDEHEIENMHSSKITSKTKEGDKLMCTSKKRKSTSLIEFERQEKIPTVQSRKNIQNVESPVSTLCKDTLDEVNNKCLHSSDVESPVSTSHIKKINDVNNERLYSLDGMRPDLSPEIRCCYVKLVKLSESDLNFSGWDDDSNKYFSGFTDTDSKNAKLKQTQFGNVFTSLVHKCKKVASPIKNKSPNTWPGWDVVPSRSIVVNGFLIDKYANKS